MQKIIIRYIALPLLTLASAFAFYYLNNVELPEGAQTASSQVDKPKKERKSIVITDPITKKKQLIIIEPPKWIDTVVTDSPKVVPNEKPAVEGERGVLPDVEFLKFVIQKSRDGIPVLSIGNYLNFI
jgi:hypothetical protein